MGLARLEGRVAIGRFVARFPDYRLAGAPVRARRARFRGHVSLPARVRWLWELVRGWRAGPASVAVESPPDVEPRRAASAD